ncbi:MAG: hypothetical protein ACRC9N_01840, partial [Aeromonas sp.]
PVVFGHSHCNLFPEFAEQSGKLRFLKHAMMKNYSELFLHRWKISRIPNPQSPIPNPQSPIPNPQSLNPQSPIPQSPIPNPQSLNPQSLNPQSLNPSYTGRHFFTVVDMS